MHTIALGFLLRAKELESGSEEGLVSGDLGAGRDGDVILHVICALPIGVEAGEIRREGSVEMGIQKVDHLLVDNRFKLSSKEVVIPSNTLNRWKIFSLYAQVNPIAR